MSEGLLPAYSVGDLRRAGAPASGEEPSSGEEPRSGREEQLVVRSARKDKREIATLRAVSRDAEFLVESEVYPVSALHGEPVRPGPYRFTSEREARAFVDDAMAALAYLGCDVG